ncbi:MAG: metallophosphoesterase [Alphaproteobacteria bacterium]|nr:metallophosphoesterase [Alphaproteobacteria bacterium]
MIEFAAPKRCRVAAWTAAVLLLATAAQAGDLPSPWVELAPDNVLSLRALIPSDAACPRATAADETVSMQPRPAGDANFPVTLCEARLPATSRSIAVDGAPLPTLPAAIRRIVVIGDTGCRLEGRAIQDCNDPAAWPFPALARLAAARKPDLVIHVGDYYYRESACPAGRAGCAGSPYGDDWAAWQADFFAPAAPLLAAAPWVTVRGNHELCRRGGKGWFRLLDPHAEFAGCADRTDPYWLHLGGLDLAVFDSAGADDFTAAPDKVAPYAAQLASLLASAPAHSWMVTHRPVWALAQGKLVGLVVNATEQAAIRGHVPPELDLVLSGHLHDFTSYQFGPDRPAQLLVGDSGDTMLDLAQTDLAGVVIDGMPVQSGLALKRFGYFVMEAAADGWNGTLYGTDDGVLAQCRLQGRALACH